MSVNDAPLPAPIAPSLAAHSQAREAGIGRVGGLEELRAYLRCNCTMAGYAEAQAKKLERFYRMHPRNPEAMALFHSLTVTMYDLVARHEALERRQVTQQLVAYATAIGAQTALDFGCGNGDDARALVEAGVMVTLADRHTPHFQYAAHRMARLARLTEMLTLTDDPAQDLAHRRWDLVVCLDVLPLVGDVEATLDALAAAADHLFIAATFSGQIEPISLFESQYIALPGNLEAALAARGFAPAPGVRYGWYRRPSA